MLFRAFKELVVESGRNPDEFARHSLHTGGSTTLVAAGGVPERVIQREGRWKSDACKAYRYMYGFYNVILKAIQTKEFN